MANINNVVDVTVNLEGKSAGRDNMNIVAIVTPERGDVLSSSSRSKLYKSAADVATDFGTESKTYAHALVAFSQDSNFVSSGGCLAVIYHRALKETTPASSGVLRGEQLDESYVVRSLQRISDGSFQVLVDGTETIEFLNLDFRTCADMSDVISVIKKGILDKANIYYSNVRISISCLTSGASSSISFATPLEAGTFLGDILGLSEGTGAKVSAGADAISLEPETQLEAITLGKSDVNFKGFTIIDKPTDATRKSLATWAQANSVLFYETFSGDMNLNVSTDNIVWDIVMSGLTNCRMVFDDSGDRKLATAYMSRMHVVNFASENTTLTMHLKSLSGVTARNYDEMTISRAKKVGLDIYTSIKDVPCLLTSGANDFTDNRYNLIAFVDSLQTDLFNLFKTTSTKIGQDQPGVDQEIDCVEKTCRGFVKAGVFAPGEWSSPDTFGDLEQFKRNVRENGYFVIAGKLSEQSQSERQERVSPPIKVACKNKGAIHSANVIVNLNF